MITFVGMGSPSALSTYVTISVASGLRYSFPCVPRIQYAQSGPVSFPQSRHIVCLTMSVRLVFQDRYEW